MTTEKNRKTNPAAHLVELLRSTVPPMHPDGRPFVLGAAITTLLLRTLWRPAGVLGTIATAWCAWFFREPRRTTPSGPGIAIAPADGVISHIEPATPPAELGWGDTPTTRISVFLTVFDVHVQRLPVTGHVTGVAYRPGKFLSADRKSVV